jgi:hypothetical protein
MHFGLRSMASGDAAGCPVAETRRIVRDRNDTPRVDRNTRVTLSSISKQHRDFKPAGRQSDRAGTVE